ncbi:MAG: NAD(P)-binding protein [Lachnospiraceae bacterium]|nr:NAD(P)-binding protein [Lachnospiraceae bacterium]
MIQISQLKLPVGHTKEQLQQKIRKMLRLGKQQEFSYEIIRQSLDARKKQDKKFVYTILVSVANESKILHKVNDKNIMLTQKTNYHFPSSGSEPLTHRPVIVGSGPAGVFCAYMLAKRGYRPLILERGEEVHKRKQKVDAFWKDGTLDLQSNVQFGEGGAGTFSDGKLNTLVKDPVGRNREVLRIFAECGAPEEIIYQHKPHLGTDALITIVETMRHKIENWGGEFCFSSQVTDLAIKENRVHQITLLDGRSIPVEVLVLAIGHSARDTFEMLYSHNLVMHQKSFAVGVRVEHPQKMINLALYGEEKNKTLGAAAYKLTAQTSNGRGAYTFCMCPGGYVVNASSEAGHLAVNGMSYQKRDSKNANSAVIVTVGPKDFDSDHPLAGVQYQRKLEKAAYALADGAVPVQLMGDFVLDKESKQLGEIIPCIKGKWQFANLRKCLPAEICQSLTEAFASFDHKISGYLRPDAVLSGVESRTSSPVRMERDENMESNIKGIYPCGEGAGYAGGITSAAMDGLKIAEKIALRFAVPEN